jgi:hypothetical protein
LFISPSRPKPGATVIGKRRAISEATGPACRVVIVMSVAKDASLVDSPCDIPCYMDGPRCISARARVICSPRGKTISGQAISICGDTQMPG